MSISKLSMIALGSLLIAGAYVDAADARDRQRSGSYTTGKGRTGSYSGSVSGNRKDGLTRSQSITTGSGKTYNRGSTTSYDRETGNFNRTVTAPNGTTRTYQGTAQDGQRSGTYTTSTGKSGSFEGSTQRNEDGSVTRSGNWTNQDGETKSRSATTSYDRESNTATRSVTGPGGNTRSGSVTVTPDSQ